jgi:hypothetical protein
MAVTHSPNCMIQAHLAQECQEPTKRSERIDARKIGGILVSQMTVTQPSRDLIWQRVLALIAVRHLGPTHKMLSSLCLPFGQLISQLRHSHDEAGY